MLPFVQAEIALSAYMPKSRFQRELSSFSSRLLFALPLVFFALAQSVQSRGLVLRLLAKRLPNSSSASKCSSHRSASSLVIHSYEEICSSCVRVSTSCRYHSVSQSLLEYSTNFCTIEFQIIIMKLAKFGAILMPRLNKQAIWRFRAEARNQDQGGAGGRPLSSALGWPYCLQRYGKRQYRHRAPQKRTSTPRKLLRSHTRSATRFLEVANQFPIRRRSGNLDLVSEQDRRSPKTRRQPGARRPST